jgi:hypothetical protein
MTESGKVCPRHLERLALVYVRHGPFALGQTTHALTHHAVLVDAALMAGSAVGVGTRVDGIDQDAVDRGVGRGAPANLAARRGPGQERQALAAEPEPDAACGVELGEAIEDGAAAPVTAASGWKRTSPSPSPQTKPIGRPRRSSPRAALLRMPPSSLARRMCSSGPRTSWP